MMGVNECLQDGTRIYLIREEDKKKKRFTLFKSKKNERRIFRKDFNHAELVGEELCNVRNLRCSHFFLIGEGYYHLNRTEFYEDIEDKGYNIRLGSYDFRDPVKYDYFQIADSILGSEHDYLEEILEFAPTTENRYQLLDEIEEMFALDTFMGQTDRYWNNVIFERDKETKEIHLAPLYDFEYSLNSSYINPNCLYDNVLHTFKSEQDYKDYIEKRPEFAEKLKFYLDIDLVDVIERSYRAKGLKVPEHVIPFYEKFEKERKDLIRRVTGEENVNQK